MGPLLSPQSSVLVTLEAERLMPARTGAEYLQGLKERQPEVWLGGERIQDVTAHPAFAGAIKEFCRLYDLQLSPDLRDQMTFEVFQISS